jgi:type I restriction enzyme, S subunit
MNETFSTKNFERVQLREISNIKPGVNVSSKKMGYGSLYVTVENLYENRFINLAKLSKADIGAKNQKEHRLEYKDIVLSKSSVKKEGIGYGCIFRNRSKLVIPSGFTVRIRSNKDKCDANFLFYSLRSYETRKWIINYSQTSALTNLNAGIINSIPISLPSLPEQKKIASILSSADEVIEKTQSQINKLQNLKKSIVNELLTKGIAHTEFKGSELGKIPKSWEVNNFNDCIEKIVDCEHRTAPKVESSDFHVVSTNAVKDGKLLEQELYNTSEEAYRDWTARETPVVDDVLFTREAPAGESCCVPEHKKVCLGQRMVLLRPISNILIGVFLNFFINSDVGKKGIYRLSLGTTVSRINMADIKKLKIIVPSIFEQKKIVNIICTIEDKISIIKKKLNKYIFIKKSLMQDLLTGKVRVSIN